MAHYQVFRLLNSFFHSTLERGSGSFPISKSKKWIRVQKVEGATTIWIRATILGKSTLWSQKWSENPEKWITQYTHRVWS